MARLSGLQSDVLSLYRRLLRLSRVKDPEGAKGLRGVVRTQFRDKALSISRSDFQQIEHWLRYGHKQIKLRYGHKQIKASTLVAVAFLLLLLKLLLSTFVAQK